LLSDNELVQFSGSILVITFVSQDSSQSLLDHLLGDVADISKGMET